MATQRDKIMREMEVLKEELNRYRKENMGLSHDLVRANTQLGMLKQQFQHKQDVSIRLLAQRNASRFLNDKVTNGLKTLLKAAQCKIAKDATVHDLFAVATQIITEASAQLVPITAERNELREELAATREELVRAENKLRELMEPRKKSAPPKDYWSDEEDKEDFEGATSLWRKPEATGFAGYLAKLRAGGAKISSKDVEAIKADYIKKVAYTEKLKKGVSVDLKPEDNF